MSAGWRAAICNRFRILVVLGLMAAIWAASALSDFHREDRWLNKFDNLKVGMTRQEVVRLVGEPQYKTVVKRPSGIYGTKLAESVMQYSYELKTFGDKSSWEISGIYLDDKEERVLFLQMERGIMERSDYFWPSIMVLAAYGALGVLLFLGLARWCAKRPGLKQRGA